MRVVVKNGNGMLVNVVLVEIAVTTLRRSWTCLCTVGTCLTECTLNKRPECYRGALEEGIMTHGQF